jgi:hypothetical protein
VGDSGIEVSRVRTMPTNGAANDAFPFCSEVASAAPLSPSNNL